MITLGAAIGAGKSSLTQILSNELGTKPFYEPVSDNPVLPLFYKGNEIAAKKRAAGIKDATNPYAYLLQTFFLNRRFKMIKQAMQQDNNVLDRSIYEDHLFMQMNVDMGNATQVELEVYEKLLENMMEEYPLFSPGKKAPDLMVMIHVSYNTMIKRITKRGREFEQIENDPSLEEYYKNLLTYYDKWEKEYDISPLLVIDGDKYDFMENLDDRKTVLQQIYDKLLEVGSIDKTKYSELVDSLTDLKLTNHEGEYDTNTKEAA
ncbi:deoxynucleoside kinase [Limosilactobacillus reuteri]|uniref:Deoxynucleoside kinase n=1 Tax=Limosilactobacillus reuteri TaxID=1598 RepID=A0A7L6BIN5_LIMRT|nr:deoxynucleoside kinase [Limosilactobacillus reuteri]QLQ61985.1 deoxynucleoside kinase [Limosilactobacillus reuteri]